MAKVWSYRRQTNLPNSVTKYKSLLNTAKTDYHSTEVAESNQRNLFRVVDRLCTPKITHALPAHKDLANSFAKYFSEKITKLRHRLDEVQQSPLCAT